MRTPIRYVKTVTNSLVRKLVLSSLLLSSTLFSFGQDTTAAPGLEHLTKLDLGLQGVGVTFERKLDNKITIDLSAGLGGGYSFSEWSQEYNWDLSPYVSITPKYFYNRDKRAAKGKQMNYNAGNYIGVRLKYSFPSLVDNFMSVNTFLVNAHWGFQRPIGKKWTINGHAGLGFAAETGDQEYVYGDDFNDQTVYPSIDFKFSYNFGKKRN